MAIFIIIYLKKKESISRIGKNFFDDIHYVKVIVKRVTEKKKYGIKWLVKRIN